MNREIKFKAWDLWNKCWYDFEDDLRFTENGFINQCKWSNMNDDRFVLVEFTGLKDKDDNEIFESDILSAFDDDTISVFFNTSMACFDAQYLGGDSDRLVPDSGWNPKEYKIIGSIYETPELIK